ncbi:MULTISPECIES: M48 family metallopeptidase [unclassified Oceanispirochaeta]|uniref:M48 family metallopeptidase n=1 Tax=unclassified Oceanispirochaeta TaxID=2635722 RepID=UPI000E09A863|nr:MULTISPECIES: M48 family metallopeptidase [unclassified Oceanispirochaeta]MBF9015550.1 M48 family metallopeptidase [Oceanispirochaeta sp. M2]NPD73961.1 M48 family metallopeptidase [Oceanispirochaeta sp. M1]RDG30271.1 M48 family peptidase [Oceanispirochaeta sp. M1]
MSPTMILTLFVVLYIAEFIASWMLSVMNMNSIILNKDEVPAVFSSSIDPENYKKSVDYSLVKGRFSLISSAWSFIFLLLIILIGFPGMLENFLLGFLHEGTLFSIIYIFVFSMIFSAASLPLSFYSQFVIEQNFGFNKTSLSLYFTDSLKQSALSVVLMTPMLWGLFFFMEKTGAFWWLYASGFIVAFQLIVLLLYPVLIAPLFNKFTPLEDGNLKTRLMALAERCGFGTNGIFLMDGSRRSGHSNAYFTGLGKFRRIVLFDTLVESLSDEELEAVLAHEIGHNKLRHIPKRLLSSILMITAALYITSLCMNWEALYNAFSFEAPAYHSILIILMFCSSPFSFFLSPLGNFWSRKHEYEADAYACNSVEEKSALKGALMMLSKDNLSNLTPHSLYSAFHYSHPALAERLGAMNLEGDSEKLNQTEEK